jgi:hypothetical protein
MPNLNELKVIPEYRDALRTLDEKEFETLRKNILADGFLDPIKYHQDPNGDFCIVDGMHRFKIWQSLPAGCDKAPKMEHVSTIDGASVEDVVFWIQRNQTGRRNDTTPEKWYAFGSRYNNGEEEVALAEEANASVASIMKWGVFASKIDAQDYSQPGLKNQLLSSGKSASAITEAIKSGNVEGLLRDEPTAPRERNHFKSAKTALASLTKTINGMSRPAHYGESAFSINCVGLCETLRDNLNRWELVEIDAKSQKTEDA